MIKIHFKGGPEFGNLVGPALKHRSGANYEGAAFDHGDALKRFPKPISSARRAPRPASFKKEKPILRDKACRSLNRRSRMPDYR